MKVPIKDFNPSPPTEQRYCIPDKRFVLKEPSYIYVMLPDKKERVFIGDRWEHMDGETLTVYSGERLLATYLPGEWKGCHAFNSGLVKEEN